LSLQGGPFLGFGLENFYEIPNFPRNGNQGRMSFAPDRSLVEEFRETAQGYNELTNKVSLLDIADQAQFKERKISTPFKRNPDERVERIVVKEIPLDSFQRKYSTHTEIISSNQEIIQEGTSCQNNIDMFNKSLNKAHEGEK